MKCPGGGDCFDVDCLRSGCQGYDVRAEITTVTHTTIEASVRKRARVNLMVGVAQPRLPKPRE